MYYLVYRTINLINSKYYVGVHKTKDLDDGYLGSGTTLKRAIIKYGIDNFEREILFQFDNPLEMFAKEAEIVTEEFVARPDTYNIKKGGSGGFDYVNRTGKNLYGSNGLSNRHFLLPGDKLRDYLVKNGLYDKWCSQISIGLKTKYATGYSPWTGRTHSLETKKKIGAVTRHLTGNRNSQYGTCWIYDPHTGRDKKINKAELDDWLSQGYRRGRSKKALFPATVGLEPTGVLKGASD